MTVADAAGPADRRCPMCSSMVPAARFCGACGADSTAGAAWWDVLLRPGTFATAHREAIWLPRISSTLFPRFPGEVRTPFRIGLIGVAVAMLSFVALRIGGPLGVTATLGWPLLFVLYGWQSDAARDIPARIFGLAAALGVTAGVGWWLAAGNLLAGSYGISIASSLMLTRVLNTGLLITLGGAGLMVVPALACRLLPMPVRESLDGFVVGAFGALCYSTAATTTIVAPQYVEGLIDDHSAARMLQDAVTYGIVNPIVTTAAGGLVGLSLWFRPYRRAGAIPGRAGWALALAAVLAVLLYLAVWSVDALALARPMDVATKLLVAVAALVTVRVAVQIALLHETQDRATGEPLLCVHCETAVPDLPFCSSCGAAARASSRTSRRLRHEYAPVPE